MPIAAADVTDVNTEKIKVVATAVSDETGDGNNFKFENVPDGKYTILAAWLMGSNPGTPYAGISEVTVSGGNPEDVDLTVGKCAGDEVLEKVYETANLLSSEEPENSGTYTVEGTVKLASGKSRKDTKLILLEGVFFTAIDIKENENDYALDITVYGAESVSAEYTNTSGSKTKRTNSTPAGSSYKLKIDKAELNAGANVVKIAAESNGKEAANEITLIKADGSKLLISSAVSNDLTSGNNFKFENVAEGEYIILATWLMGSNPGTPYAGITEIRVENTDVTDADLTVEKCADNKTYADVYEIASNYTEKIPVGDGTYSIEGVVKLPSGKNRKDVKLYLLEAPLITNISYMEDETNYIIDIAAFGADTVKAEYKDSAENQKTKTNASPSENVYEIFIPKNDLIKGYNTISVTAAKDSESHYREMTIIKADPADLGIPRKVVIISGYETHNKIINALAEEYKENGSNVELVSIETKAVPRLLAEEGQTALKEAFDGADVITIHMVSTNPTWNQLQEFILTECEGKNTGDEKKIVVLDDNTTRYREQNNVSKGYGAPPVPGISDTEENFSKYRAKIAEYWSNTPFEHSNLESMVNTVLIDFYSRYDLRQPSPAVALPIKAIYHPHMNSYFETEYTDYINWYKTNEEIWEGEEEAYIYNPENPTVGIAVYKSYYPDKMDPIDKMIEELEKKGINVIAAYCEAPPSGEGSLFDSEDRGGKYFRAGEIDAILNYRYIGSHRFDEAELDVPVFNILIVDAYEDWMNSSNPLGNGTMKLVNQEAKGAIDPIAAVSTEVIDGATYNRAIPEQIDWLVGRVVGQLNLQSTDNADKNIAVVYYNHGGGKGNIGASYMDVPASTIELLNGLEKADYNIDLIKAPDKDALINAMTTQGINVGGWAPGELKKLIGGVDVSEGKEYYDTGKAVLISDDLYLEWFKESFTGEWFEESIKNLEPEAQAEKRIAQEQLYSDKRGEVEELWGSAPGNIMVYENKYIIIPYIEVTGTDGDGRVILTPQPARGHEENIETLYHSTNIPPTHQYIAFYLWLQHKNEEGTVIDGGDSEVEIFPKDENAGFSADAVVHLGRHGTQEWLPGKQTALSRYDWPALMAGDVPIIYPYIVDGVGEGIISKRRGNAVIVDHMTPAIVYADLYGEYAELNEAIFNYENDAGTEAGLKEGYKQEIIKKMNETGIDKKLDVTKTQLNDMTDEDFGDILHEAEEILEDLKSEYMPYGLHVLGVPLSGDILNEMVYSMLSEKYIGYVKETGLGSDDAYSLLVKALDSSDTSEKVVSDFYSGKSKTLSAEQKNNITGQLDLGKNYAEELGKSREIEQVLKALRGEHIEAKAGGDPVRSPQVLPTGGNFQTVDQRRIPTETAWEVGKMLADQMLADYYNKHGEWPSTVGYVLWAGETTRTDGIMEAQIMYLIGMEPKWSGGNVDANNFTAIPADQLTINLNGQIVERPRIDVVVEISGAYRDTFPEKVLMLDRAIRQAYEQPDGDKYANYIKRNTDAIYNGGKNGISQEDALSRIFGPASDTYGTGLDDLIGSTGSWNDSSDIAKQFISRMSHVYNSLGDWGGYKPDQEKLYQQVLSNVDATVHSRSSALYGAVDNDDFYQYLGGLNLAVSYARNDGKYPESYVMNLQNYKIDADGNWIGGTPAMDTLQDFLEKEFYARYMNQKWFDGMKQHDYAGAREIAKVLDNLWGWAVTNPDLISDKMWNDIYEQFLTGENGEWLKSEPYSYQSSVARLIQAIAQEDGKYWNANQEVLNQLIKDYVESVVETGVACCHHTCGNPTFDKFIAGQLSVAGVNPEDQEEFLKTLQEATERPIPTDKKSGNTNGSGFGQAVVSDSAAAPEQKDEGENGGGYGTDASQAPGEVSGYQMTPSFIDNSISSIRDFVQNPTFSASSMIAIAMVVLVVGAVFYGFRRKD